MARHDDFDLNNGPGWVDRIWVILLCFALAIVAILWMASCGPIPVPPGPPAPPPTPGVWLADAVACRAVGSVPYACQEPIPGATIQMHTAAGYVSQTADGAGYAVFPVPAGFSDSDVVVDAPGYLTARQHIDVAGTHDSPRHNIVVLTPAHVDPSSIPLEQLAAVRGAMWPTGLGLPFGPRPGSPDNIIATDFFADYAPSDQVRLLAWEKAQGYTHVVVGPIVDSDGYHGTYAPNDWRGKFDAFLDVLQAFWDNGQAPIVFVHPDGWTLEQTKALTPLFQSARAQRLMRIVVPHGWEPCKYECSSYTWAAYGEWARETWPNALILLHTVSDVDAPVGTDTLGDDNGHPNAEGWARVAPFYHGWLTQSAAFADPATHGDPNHPEKTNFDNWQDNFRCAVSYSYCNRFHNGYAGWPTTSAWGAQPLRVYAGEYSAYWKFWAHRTEAEGTTWGDAAMAAGADGYLDSGSVPVPVRQ